MLKVNLSVLLVDDDIDDQFFFKESIMQVEHKIELSVADNGNQAEKIITVTKPSLIFLDINMPGQSGKEFLENLRKKDDFNDVKVIMFTTSSNGDDIDDCYRLGANLYITKPLSSVAQGILMQKLFNLYAANQLFTGDRQNFVFKQ